MARPLKDRKADMLYLAFFCIHIPVMLLQDLTPLYPRIIHTYLPFLDSIRSYYITTYSDPLFINPPAWMTFYIWMEALYHVPLSVWVIGGIMRDDPMVPLQLLIWSLQTAITTGTCIAFHEGGDILSVEQKSALGWLYRPYLLLAVGMFVDCFFRVRRQVLGGGRAKGGKIQ